MLLRKIYTFPARNINNVLYICHYKGEMLALENVAKDVYLNIPSDKEILFEDLVKTIHKKYTVNKEVLSNDLRHFVDQLYNRGFISIDGERKSIRFDRTTTTKASSKYSAACYENYLIAKVHFELTSRCNLKCIQCYIEDSPHKDSKELSTDEVKQTIDDLYGLGCLSVGFTGGEAFKRNDIVEIIEYTIKKGFLVRILTNGTLINEEMIKKIKNIPIRTIEMTFFGASADTHDKVTRVSGSFERLVNNIQKMNKEGIYADTVAKLLLMKSNKKEIDDFHKLADNINVDVHFHSAGILFPQRDKIGKNESAIDAQTILDMLSVGKLDLKNVVKTACVAGKSRATITANGDVVPCEQLSAFRFGNIRNDSLMDIWHNSKAIQDFRSLKINGEKMCNTCSYIKYCLRCPAMAYLHDGDIERCSCETLRFAKIAKEFYEE